MLGDLRVGSGLRALDPADPGLGRAGEDEAAGVVERVVTASNGVPPMPAWTTATPFFRSPYTTTSWASRRTSAVEARKTSGTVAATSTAPLVPSVRSREGTAPASAKRASAERIASAEG